MTPSAVPTSTVNGGEEFSVQLPIHISQIGGRYLIFDVEVATWLRKEHRMCGVTVGTLPQIPSQNVFLGLPVELMPEEAYFLAETGVASVVDEAAAHRQALGRQNRTRRFEYRETIQDRARRIEAAKIQEKEITKAVVMKKKRSQLEGGRMKDSKVADSLTANDNSSEFKNTSIAEQLDKLFDFDDVDPPELNSTKTTTLSDPIPDEHNIHTPQTTQPLHQLRQTQPSDLPLPTQNKPPSTSTSSSYNLTPTTSQPLLSPFSADSPTTTPPENLPPKPPSYDLYAHLHTQKYFLTPGLRFGCQYTVYPGDPLRFHSHFLAIHTSWDEEIDLMDLLGGGRLGTGVKKGFLFGGLDPKSSTSHHENGGSEALGGLNISDGLEGVGRVDTVNGDGGDDGPRNKRGKVRTFSVEWAAM